MKKEILPNGNLKLIAEASDADTLADIKQRHVCNDVCALVDILEDTGWRGNGVLMDINPEDVGALTEALMLTDDRTIEGDGSVTVNGNVWWFPDYCVTNFLDELIEKGYTIFHAAPENKLVCA